MDNKHANYQLKSIELLDLIIGHRVQQFIGKEFQFNISANAKVNPQAKVVFIVVSIEASETGNEAILGKIETAIGFEIINFEDVIKPLEENLYDIPTNLEVHLRTISISTTRGIMWSHFKGTHLNGAILPIVPQLVTPQEENELKDKDKVQ